MKHTLHIKLQVLPIP